MKVFKPTKEITGVEPSVGAIWEIGRLPKARIVVRKDADDVWVIAVETCGGASTDLLSFPCETCAKAAAYDLTNTFGSATCPQHNRSQLTYPVLLDASIALLKLLMGLCDSWDRLTVLQGTG